MLDKRWDIVLLTNVLPFIQNVDDLFGMLETVEIHLSKNGIFFIQYAYLDTKENSEWHVKMQEIIAIGFNHTSYEYYDKCNGRGNCSFAASFKLKPKLK